MAKRYLDGTRALGEVHDDVGGPTVRERISILLIALLAAATLGWSPPPAHPVGTPPPPVRCSGSPAKVHRLDLTVAGERTYGLYAVPRGAPKGLVVFFHGYTHTPYSWTEHLTQTARRNRVIAVAMNYRGNINIPASEPGARPTARGWQVAEGAVDSIKAAKLFDSWCGTPTVVAYSISMGSNAGGLAIAAKPTHRNGDPLFDYWFNVEGATNVTETYHEARMVARSGNTFAVNAVEDIEREMGGTFEERREVYLQRTVVNRAEDVAAAGLRGTIMIHGLDDGLVPYNQTREMAERLRSLGRFTDVYTVLTRGEDSEAGTTATGYAPTGQQSPLAGHASEASSTHIINETGFDLLAQVLRGAEIGCREFLVDGTLGTTLVEDAPSPC